MLQRSMVRDARGDAQYCESGPEAQCDSASWTTKFTYKKKSGEKRNVGSEIPPITNKYFKKNKQAL